MADSLEKENLATWLRRPSIFVANAWYLLAAAGLYLLPWLWQVLAGLFPGLVPLLEAMTSPIYNLCLLAFPAAMYAAVQAAAAAAPAADADLPRPSGVRAAALRCRAEWALPRPPWLRCWSLRSCSSNTAAEIPARYPPHPI